VRISRQSRLMRCASTLIIRRRKPGRRQAGARPSRKARYPVAAVLSGSAGSALPGIDHAARTPLFLAIQVAM
jgi:hypothetical protein